MFGSSGSPTVPSLQTVPNSVPGSQNLLLISQNILTFSSQQSSTVLDFHVPQVHQDHAQFPPRQVYVAPRHNRFNDNAIISDFSVAPWPSQHSLSIPGPPSFTSRLPAASAPVVNERSHPSSSPSYHGAASALSSSFGLSDRSDRSSSLTNTVEAIGWNGFMHSDHSPLNEPFAVSLFQEVDLWILLIVFL